MAEHSETKHLRNVVAVLRVTLGVIILVTWYDNLMNDKYTADGITGLFNYIFNDNGGGPTFYRDLVRGTILQVPGAFGSFQMVAELLMGLGLLVGGLTPMAGAAATIFFLNLFLAYLGGQEWIWTYVLLAVSALVITASRAGRSFGLDHYLFSRRGRPPLGLLW